MRAVIRAATLVTAIAISTLIATGCSANDGGGESAPAEDQPVTIQIGYENTDEEPIGQAVQRWAELVEEESDGSITFELFPNSSLGSKNELIDQMELGESVITIADGAFYADYGVPDMGIMYGPFFFETWDDVWALVDSDWYAEQSDLLADQGLTLLASNWVYGERHLMTNSPVSTPDDLEGMKIRLANAPIYIEGFATLGATPVGMDLADVYTSLETGVIDGVENPLSTLYGRSFQEVSKNILLTGHIKNFSTWVAGTQFMSTLSENQQEILRSTAEEAGVYNNELQVEAEAEYSRLLEAAGVTIRDMSEDELAAWREAAMPFYDRGDEFGWSEGLYETTQEAMGR